MYLGERYCITVPPCTNSSWGNAVPPTKYLGERRPPAFPLHYTIEQTSLYNKIIIEIDALSKEFTV